MARVRPLRGERLAIVGNGQGLGRIAAGTLLRHGGRLAQLAPETSAQLSGLMRTGMPAGNPLALPPDLSPASWTAALEALADKGVDAVLTVYSPSPFANGNEVADAIGAASKTVKNIFSCWVGGTAMQEAQQVPPRNSGVLSPRLAGKGHRHFPRHRQLRAQPRTAVADAALGGRGFRAEPRRARDAVPRRSTPAPILPPRAARQLLLAYGIESEEAMPAGNIDEAIASADEIGYPVDLALVLANDLEHTLVARELRSPEDIRIATRGLRARARAEFPGVRVSGYRLRPSIARSGLPPLRLGVADDPCSAR
jgi:acetyltransferase